MNKQLNPKAGLGAMLTPDNCVLILIDHQPFQFAGLRSHDTQTIINNVVGLAKSAKAFGVPTLLTTVVEERGGYILKQLQDVFPEQKPIDRTFINTWEDARCVDWVRKMGADEVVGRDFGSQIKNPVHYIAVFNDLDGHWPAIGELIAPQGGIVSIVGNLKPLPMDAVRSKSASLCWELMFTRARYKTPDMIEQHRLLNQVADWLDSGKLRGTLKQVLTPINAVNLRKAHQKLESGTMIGKLVLKDW